MSNNASIINVTMFLFITLGHCLQFNATFPEEIPPLNEFAAGRPKRGLPFFNPPTFIHNFNGKGSKVNWAFNWDSYMDPDFPSYLEFVPLLYGLDDKQTNPWLQNANHALSRGSGHLMAFNEPESCSKGLAASCLSPQAAVDGYRKYLMPFASRASIGAPAVANGPTGLNWMQDFLRLCTGCKIDFVPVHWYGPAGNVQDFYDFVGKANKVAGSRRVWITEFNGASKTNNVDEQIKFLKTVMPWLDKQSFVSRYAWFRADPRFIGGSLVDEHGNPTKLGSVYTYSD